MTMAAAPGPTFQSGVPLLTRRAFLIARSSLAGTSWLVASKVVASWALANPDVDMDERKTWTDWCDAL